MRYVIGDIHGCYKTFSRLIQEIQPDQSDQLILLGDYVSKGPSVLAVIRTVQELKNSMDIVALRGNHDQLLLDHFSNPTPESSQQQIKLGNHTLFPFESEVTSFLEDLPYWHEDEAHIYVHAGLNFDLENPLTDTHSMMNIRTMSYDAAKVSGKKVIHGHVPITLENIKGRIQSAEKTICLDNGCVYKDIEGMGNLLCLNIDENRLLKTPNQD